jgi:hypothetical protein
MGSKTRGPTDPTGEKPAELVDFLQDVALGKRAATEEEIEEAQKELGELLPDASEDV